MNFVNKDYNGIYYSRFIASWMKTGGNPRKEGEAFKKWLKTLGLPENVIKEIWDMVDNGKYELEVSAFKFRRDNKR